VGIAATSVAPSIGPGAAVVAVPCAVVEVAVVVVVVPAAVVVAPATVVAGGFEVPSLSESSPRVANTTPSASAPTATTPARIFAVGSFSPGSRYQPLGMIHLLGRPPTHYARLTSGDVPRPPARAPHRRRRCLAGVQPRPVVHRAVVRRQSGRWPPGTPPPASPGYYNVAGASRLTGVLLVEALRCRPASSPSSRSW
jgi:hypothetical protein